MKIIIRRIIETLLRMAVIIVCIAIFGLLLRFALPIITKIPTPILGAILLICAFICLYFESKDSDKRIEEHNKIEWYKAEVERLQILISEKNKEKE